MDRSLLERLYVQEKLGYREIAKQLGISESSVYRCVSRFGLIGQRDTIDDLTGRKFGKLEVLKYVQKGRYPNGGIYHVWECKCECGRLVSVRAGNLKNGQTTCKSCASDALSGTLAEFPFDSKVWFRMVYRCRRKGLELTISPARLHEIFLEQNGCCAISGVPICFGKSGHRLVTTASPDRIDPTKGYIDGNVQWVHKVVNSMRNNMTREEFVSWCRRIIEHNEPLLSCPN